MNNALQDRPLPWIAAVGIDEESALRTALDRMGGTVAYVDSLAQLRQTDFEFVVSIGDLGAPAKPHLNVLHFLGPDVGATDDYLGSAPGYLFHVAGARAARFEVGDGAKARGLEGLVRESILQHVPVGGDYKILRFGGKSGPSFESFAGEVEGGPLGLIRTNDNNSEWWLLPH